MMSVYCMIQNTEAWTNDADCKHSDVMKAEVAKCDHGLH